MDAFLFHSTSRSLYPEVMADLATLDSETFLCQNFQFGINTLFFRSNNNISTQKKSLKPKKGRYISTEDFATLE